MTVLRIALPSRGGVRALFLLVLAVLCAAGSVRAAAAQTVTVQMISAPDLTLDSNKPTTDGPQAAYVAFRVTNGTAATLTNVRATLGGFANGITLGGTSNGTPQQATQFIGSLAPNAVKVLYWFVEYPTSFGVSAPLSVTITDGSGGSYSGTGTVTTKSMVSSQAGGNLMSGTMGVGAVVGQILSYDVAYEFGGVSAGDSYNLQVAGNRTFRADCFQMIGMEVVASAVTSTTSAAVGTKDTPYFKATTSQGGSKIGLTMRYYFKYLCSNIITKPFPYGNQFSGGQLKYSANYLTYPQDLGPTFPTATNPFTISKTVDQPVLSGATTGPVTYTITITNPSAYDAVIDSVVDQIPSGVTFQGTTAASGITAANSASSPSAGASGRTVWRGNPGSTYLIAKNSTLTLVYTANVQRVAGPYTNSASAWVGSTQLGGYVSATVTVGSANLMVTKTGPARVAPGDSAVYVVLTKNQGPVASTNVVVTDSFPAGTTIKRTTGSPTVAGQLITWPAIASLAANATRTDTVVLFAPNTLGTISNVAKVTALTPDTLPADNRSVAQTIVEVANLSVTKTGPARSAPGDSVRYVITTTNLGPSTSTSVVVTDTLPAGMVFKRASRSATAVGQAVTWPAITMVNGDVRTDTVVAFAPASLGAVNNVARVSALTPDTATANNRATAQTLVEVANLSITKTGPAQVAPGDSARYVITVSNAGPSAVSNVVVTDTMPAGTTFKRATGSPTQAGQVLTWPTLASLAANQTRTDTVVLIAPAAGGTMGNIAGVTAATPDTASTNNRSVAQSVVALADLFVTKTGPTQVAPGDSARYVITTTNLGPSAAANVVVTDSFPSGATFKRATGSPTVAGQRITWPTIASLAVNGTRVDTVVLVLPTASGTISNIANASTTTLENVTANNRAVAQSAVGAANLSITKTGPARVAPGDSAVYVITVTNLGPLASTSVVVTDTMPAGTTFKRATGSPTQAGQVLTWPTIASLAVNATRTDTVVLFTPAAGGTVGNIAGVTSSTPDTASANNRSVAQSVVALANVSVTKTGPAQVAPGDSARYVITVTNAGPSLAANVVVTDSFPSGAVFKRATGSPTVAGQLITWPTIASMAVNGTRTDTVVLVVPTASGTIGNIANVSTTTLDTAVANNRSVAQSAVGAANLAIAKTGPARVAPGDSAVYVITVTNLGPLASTGVVVTDTMPAGTTFKRATGSPTQAGQVLTWPTIASLAVNATRTDTVVLFTPAAGGTVGNIAGVTSSTPDTASANNRSVAQSVVALADLAVSKTGTATVVAGDTVRYVITTSNAGPSAATSVVVSDTLPAGVTFVRATNSPSRVGQVLTWPAIASLAAGASRVDTVVVNAPMAVTTITNIAAGTTATLDTVARNNNGTASGSRATTQVTTSVTVTAVPATLQTQLQGGKYGQVYRVRNLGATAGIFDVLARLAGTAGTPTVFLSTDSVAPVVTPGTRSGVRPDSLRLTINGRDSVDYRVWYTVPVGDTATNSQYLRARAAADTLLRAEATVNIRRVFPRLTLTKAVSPTGTVASGTDLTYTMVAANTGEFAATGVVLTDSVPVQTRFKIGSVGQVLPSGIAATVSYSKDGGATWTYVPGSDAACVSPAGYDGCVRRIRWTLDAPLPATVAASTSTFTFVARLR